MIDLWSQATAMAEARASTSSASTNMPFPVIQNLGFAPRADKGKGAVSPRLTCPQGGSYPGFRLYDGPRCPNGHLLRDGIKQVFRFSLIGPTNRMHLINTLSDTNAMLRATAVGMLRRAVQARYLSESEVRRYLGHALQDTSRAVRSTAIRQFALLADVTPQDVETLELFLGNEDVILRATTAETLGQMKKGITRDQVVETLIRRLPLENDAIIQGIISNSIKEVRNATANPSTNAVPK